MILAIVISIEKKYKNDSQKVMFKNHVTTLKDGSGFRIQLQRVGITLHFTSY